MKILHLASGNRWTGAAAPALAEVEALRAAGIDAHYAYIGGHKLEARLAGVEFAHPAIEKAQNPISFRRSLAAIEQLIQRHSIELIHAHLSYDHWLARFAARRHRLKLVRTFHSRRTLRRDPFSRTLVGGTDRICIVNDTFADAALVRHRNPVFTPPPLDERLFTANGPDVRARYGLSSGDRLVTVIGKIAKNRGFEEALQSFAWLRKSRHDVRLMIIGHGEHRGALETMAHELDVASSVIWAGYHEEELPAHYRASDILLFTAAGSDEGHRAIIEAMACGVAPATFPIPGVSGVLGNLAPDHVAREGTPAALAFLCNGLLQRSESERQRFRQAYIARAAEFAYDLSARRLMTVYGLE